MALAINAIIITPPEATFMGMTWVDWVSYVFVATLQVVLFLKGIAWIEKFLNFAGPAVYVVMIGLLVAIWVQAGDRLLPAVGSIFNNSSVEGWAAVGAFFGVIGTMIAYFSAVIINFGDFARFSKTEKAMRRGNFYGLPVSLTFFTFLSLFTTAGAYIVLQGGEGEPLTNPAEIVGLVGNVFLTIIAAITFVIATIGINLVANFIPPAYDLSNLNPQRISFKTGGYLTAALGFIVGALWVATISQIGLPMFVDTLGAILAPLYGVLVADYYIVQRRSIKVADLFSMDEGGRYFYQKGWNMRALIAIGIAAIFSIAAVWVPALHGLSGFAWVIGAAARRGAVHRGDVVVPAEGRCCRMPEPTPRRADRRRSASLNGGQAPRHPRRKDLPRRVLPACGGRDRRRAHRRCRRSPRPGRGSRTVLVPDDAVLLPGLVDSHVHVNEPGRTEWEGFRSATLAAAAGGVTTIVDMPLNSLPPTTTAEALGIKKAAAAPSAYIDIGFWGGAVPENLGALAPLHEAGVFGFKCFLSPSGVDEFPHLTARSSARRWRRSRRSARGSSCTPRTPPCSPRTARSAGATTRSSPPAQPRARRPRSTR